ncbi:hypothetical protein 1 [Beihai sobemo-like virus 10]|uniref:hypothetical protein 1 n=1 Tax=Beihai sobemo-like virus 10 TaxID=1922681 RepID=UPI0009095ED9|nr:hypothetical protein 1 [Beihai sobemo-like virus 10]APG75699.1 hypothetical protein 1 [Beihai sobemo-like virus 10]
MISSIAEFLGNQLLLPFDKVVGLVAEKGKLQVPTRESFLGYVVMAALTLAIAEFFRAHGNLCGRAYGHFLGACASLWKYCVDRMQRPATGDVASQRFGYFQHGDEHYWRCRRTSKLYRVEPGRGQFYIDDAGVEQYEVMDYIHVLVQGSELIQPEANLLHGEVPLPFEGLHKSVVAIFQKNHDGEFAQVGHGHRCGDYLFTNAHVHDATNGDVYFSKDLKKFWPVGEFTYFVKNYSKATGNDLGAYFVSRGTWAASGVSTFQATNYWPQSEGRIEITAYDDVRGKHMIAKGHVYNQTLVDAKLGMVPHSAITKVGWSGAPVFMMKGQKRTIVGIHCGGGSDGSANYACSIYELLEFRRRLGLEPKIPLVCEAKFISPPSKTKQFDRYDEESPEERERREDSEMLTREAEEHVTELLHGEANSPPKKDISPEAKLPGPTWYEHCHIDAPHSPAGTLVLHLADDVANMADLEDLDIPDGPPSSPDPDLDGGAADVHVNAVLAEYILRARAINEEVGPPPGLFPSLSEAEPPEVPQEEHEPEEHGGLSEPIYMGNPQGEPVTLGPQISPEERERGQKTFESRASRPLWAKAFLGVGLLGATALSPSGRAVTDEKARSLLRCSPQDLAEARKMCPISLLATPAFDRYRGYLGSGDVDWVNFESHKIVNQSNVTVAATVGTSRLYSKETPLTKLPGRYREVISEMGLGPEQGFEDYVMPPSGAEAVKESLESQLNATCHEPWPKEVLERDGGNYLRDELHSEAGKYPLAFSSGISQVHDFVVKLAKEFDGTKSSGWSAHYRPGPKSAWQCAEGLETASYLVRCRLLLRLAWGAHEMSKMTPEQMVQNGLSDPKVASIKSEPHAPRKAANKKWRVIWGASIIDLLAQGVTCRIQDKLDIHSYQDGTGQHSQAVGLGHHPEGIQMIGKHIERLQATGHQLFDADASGWDMSVKRDSILMDAERRIRCYVGPYHEIFAALQMAEAMTNSAHMLAFGPYLFSIYLAGITASGILPTTSQNSFMRAFIARLVGIIATLCGGDDLMGAGKFDPAYERRFGPIEKKITYREQGEPIEFTSFLFRKENGVWKADFVNLGKSCAKLAFSSKPVTPDQLGGVLYHLRDNESNASLFREICRKMDWPIEGAIAGPDGDQG